MNTIIRRSISAAAGAATLAGTGLALCAPTAQASTSPFPAATSARVASGWTAVETSSLTQTASPTLIYAVSPTGAQKLVLRLPHDEHLSAVSGDGRRVSVLELGAHGSIVKVYDLSTHKVTTLPTRANATLFTNPKGLALYAWSEAGTKPGPVVRVDLKGRVQARFPGITAPTVVSSADGRLVWGSAGNRVTISDNATGRVLRTFATPRGYTQCYPTHGWNATTMAGACWRSGKGGPQTFLFSTSGHVSGPVTGAMAGAHGYMDVWNTPAGLVAEGLSAVQAPQFVLKTGSKLRSLPVFHICDVRGTTVLGETPATGRNNPETFASISLPSMKVHRLLIPASGRDITGTVTNDANLGMSNSAE